MDDRRVALRAFSTGQPRPIAGPPRRGVMPSVYSLWASMISRMPSALVAGVGVAPDICSMVIAMFVPSTTLRLCKHRPYQRPRRCILQYPQAHAMAPSLTIASCADGPMLDRIRAACAVRATLIRQTASHRKGAVIIFLIDHTVLAEGYCWLARCPSSWTPANFWVATLARRPDLDLKKPS
jgi:hypothetical protein